MTKRSTSAVLIGAGMLACAVGLAQAQVAIPPLPPMPPKPPFATPADAITARRAAMKTEGGILQSVNKALQAGESPSGFAPDIQWIADWGKQMPTMFPPGSDAGDTKALPTVWSDKATFDQKAADLVAAADKLAKMAADKDTADFTTQFKAVGATCGGCHRTFKAT
jgi:cytochrome c556